MRDHYALLRETQQGFAAIRAQQAAQQGSRLDKSLAALRSHFNLDNPETVEQLHKSVAEPSDYAARRIKQARQRSRSTTHDADLETPQEDAGPKYEIQTSGPEWVPPALRLQAQEHLKLLAGEASARARMESRKSPRRGES